MAACVRKRESKPSSVNDSSGEAPERSSPESLCNSASNSPSTSSVGVPESDTRMTGASMLTSAATGEGSLVSGASAK